MSVPKNGYKALRKSIDEGRFDPLYIFHGEEEYLRDNYLSQVRETLTSGPMQDFNLVVFEGKGATPEALEAALDAMPVFSEKKLIILRNFDIAKPDKAMREALEELVPVLPDYAHIVIVHNSPEYKPDGRTKLAKLLSVHATLIEFARQEQADLIPWIKRRFRAHGREIDTRDAEYLIFLCGSLMTPLTLEIEKVAAFAQSERVKRSDIDAVAVPLIEAVMYDMTDAVAERDFARALHIMSDLSALGHESVNLLGALGRQMRQLYSAALALKEGKGAPYLSALWAFRSSYPADRLLRAARKLTPAWCAFAVRACADTDGELKSALRGRERALELLMCRLADAM